jgi:hypothetical protein
MSGARFVRLKICVTLLRSKEELMSLHRIIRGRDSLSLRELQPLALQFDWRRQREMWACLKPRPTTGCLLHAPQLTKLR